MGDSAESDVFTEIVDSSSKIAVFLQEHPIKAPPQRIPSRWRSGNDVYVFVSDDGRRVLKRINQDTWKEEIQYQKKLHEVYGDFVPEVVVQDGRTYIMPFVEGEPIIDLFNARPEKVIPLLRKGGVNLRQNYESGQQKTTGKATGQLSYTQKYRGFGTEVEQEELDRALPNWEEPLRAYPAWTIHNDTNSANLRIAGTGEIKAIDSRADVHQIRDVAKDLGRTVASAMCAAYDHGYTAEETRQAGLAFTAPWDSMNSELEKRTAFYSGQSWLSFSRWDCDNLAGPSLFPVGLDILKRRPQGFKTLGDVADATVEALQQYAKPKDYSQRELLRTVA